VSNPDQKRGTFAGSGLHGQVGDLFENHGAIKLIIDPSDGTIVAANKAAREFYGYPNLLKMRIGEINLLTEAEVAEEEGNYFLFRHSSAIAGVRTRVVLAFPQGL
jgi:PAS domain-containing protein